MDVQSRAGLGRLSEVMGPDLVRFDLERRRMGMPASAKASWEEICKDSLSRIAVEAYSAGVNAWIGTLHPADYPFEFKLLDYAPEPWTPLKSIAILKNMQWTLSKGSDDVLLTHSLEKLGPEVFAELFPLRNPGAEPIFSPDIFPGHGHPLSQRPKVIQGPLVSRINGLESLPPLTDTFFPRPQRGSGSDNFVLAGNRTVSGHPILGNDPHLDLTLPSIWYESQMQGDGINAYGVSIPGLPSLVIGFNEHIAWGLTNGMDDVYDWYELHFRDSSLREYLWKGKWLPTRFVLDTIQIRGSPPTVDTEIWTVVGPVPVKNQERPFDLNTPPVNALRWTALEPSNEIGAFLRLLSAGNYRDFRSAIARLSCPSQNFIFADTGDIALVHQGHIPVKLFGQGRTVVSYSDSATASFSVSDSFEQRYIPDSLLPYALNPKQGWLASANQEVTDSSYPFYLGSGFYPSERAGRLHRLLQPMEHATLTSAWNIMMNVQSLHAQQTLPLLLRCVDSTSVSSGVRQALKLLQGWDYRYLANSPAPALFELWWKNFYRHTWEDKFSDTAYYAWPSRPVTRALLASDTSSRWFDDTHTPQHETGGSLARLSLQEAVQQSLQLGGGTFVPWNQIHPMTIPHLLRLPSLGSGPLSGDGCAECLNAQRGSHGPSWRMAVELDSVPVALGGYPGGQSGNPGSPAYNAFVEDWLAGRPYQLLFLKHAGEEPDSIAYELTLTLNSQRGAP
jgi:penicillin amidase